jgi:anti-sigma regulatory factor (Ser/Thr protein kinase)
MNWMAVAQHPWYFETDTPRDAVECRRLLERYLSDHCEDSDVFPAAIIFGELISNVVKHAPNGGVRVWLEPEGERFALCINDSGPGFGEGQIKTQPDECTEDGRGLFIVRHVSEALSYGRLNGGFLVRAVLPLRRRAAS